MSKMRCGKSEMGGGRANISVWYWDWSWGHKAFNSACIALHLLLSISFPGLNLDLFILESIGLLGLPPSPTPCKTHTTQYIHTHVKDCIFRSTVTLKFSFILSIQPEGVEEELWTWLVSTSLCLVFQPAGTAVVLASFPHLESSLWPISLIQKDHLSYPSCNFSFLRLECPWPVMEGFVSSQVTLSFGFRTTRENENLFME